MLTARKGLADGFAEWKGCGRVTGIDTIGPSVILNLFQDRHPPYPNSMMFQPCIYIMTNRSKGLPYIGVTSNLLKRIYEHREGIADGYSRRYNLHRLVYFEQFATMVSAIAREKQLKNWHRAWKVNLIEETNPDWRDLAEDLGFEPLR